MSPVPRPLGHRSGTPGPRRRSAMGPALPGRTGTWRFGRRAAATGAAVLVSGLALAGCGADSHAAAKATDKPRLRVDGAFLPQPVTTALAAGFFTVRNTGGADTLTSVTSGLAADATLHTTKGGQMREQASFPVPANGTLDFTRGGNHLMLEKLTRKPKVGEHVPVELHFKRSGTVKVSLTVKPATYDPGSGT